MHVHKRPIVATFVDMRHIQPQKLANAYDWRIIAP